MIAVGDIVRLVAQTANFRVAEVAEGWDPGTYVVTIEGGNTRFVLRDCYTDQTGQVRDSVGNPITKVGREPEAKAADVNEDGQLEIL